ncbi:MAG TPA: hypothetical protein VFF16_20595 [Telluria sp.]|nr:hypothetical protein [Telluria sp.]
MAHRWSGRYEGGGDAGTVTLTLDGPHARLLIRSDTPGRPSLLAGFARPTKRGRFALRTEWIAALNPESGYPEPWEILHRFFLPQARLPIYAELEGRLAPWSVRLAWTTSLGERYEAKLARADGLLGRLQRLVNRSSRSPG